MSDDFHQMNIITDYQEENENEFKGIIRWVLQDCGMGDIIGQALEKRGLLLVLVVFLITALVRASVQL